MEKQSSTRYKSKKKTTPKPKTSKKGQSDGPTCSMFLAELSRKFALKKKQEDEDEEKKGIVQTIIDSITNALPIKFSRRSPQKKESPVKIETLQTLAPELLPNDILSIPPPEPIGASSETPLPEIEPTKPGGFKMPKMPLANSDVFKKAIERRSKVPTADASINTGNHDVASDIAKYVGTLKKISLIAEEFNQKTAKNLKEIVDSVQEDLIKKLEEIQAERKLALSAEKVVQIDERSEIMDED